MDIWAFLFSAKYGNSSFVNSQIGQYFDYMMFSFTSPITSTGLVTAAVTPLSTIPVYKNNGASQATTSDMTQNLHYILTFVDTLNSGAGGFVLR